MRRGRPSKKCMAATAGDVIDQCSHEQDMTTAEDKTVIDHEAHTGCSESPASQICSNVNQVLVETTSVDCSDAVDISDAALAINSLENGVLYVLQPLDSSGDLHSAQNVECRTLRLLSQTDGDKGEAAPTVLIAASSADVISGPANLAHFLRSAGIADVKPAPANQPQSTM